MKETKLQKEIFRKIVAERARQEEIHGGNSILGKDPLEFENFAVLGEEVGEVGRALLEVNYSAWHKAPREKLKEELVQAAAVIVAWLEALEEDEAS